MKENKTNWWLIIGIIVVVAIITALVTMQVTGNVVSIARPTGEVTTCTNNCYNLNCANASIRGRSACKAQCANSCARVDVYTKAEVDALLANFSSGSSGSTNVDCMFFRVPAYSDLNSSIGTNYLQADRNQDKITTGSEWAVANGRKCLYGFRVVKASTPEGIDYIGEPMGCEGGLTMDDLEEMKFPLSESYLMCKY